MGLDDKITLFVITIGGYFGYIPTLPTSLRFCARARSYPSTVNSHHDTQCPRQRYMILRPCRYIHYVIVLSW